MTGETLWELLMETFRQIARDLTNFMPKIFIALVVLVIAILVIRLLNISLGRILKFAELDKLVKKLTGFSLPFTLNSLIIFLADLGIALIALYSILGLFLEAPHIQMVTEGLYYGARIISIIVIAIFLFSIFGVGISKIRVETRLRGYIWFIILMLVTAMLVDVTALSAPVKNALTTGLSIGIGISVGVFAIWFFFHDYLDKMFKIKTEASSEERDKG